MAELSNAQLEQLWQAARPEGLAAATGAPPTPVGGPLHVNIRPPGVVPPIGVESAGSPGATTLPTVPSALPAPEIPTEVKAANTQPKPSEGMSDLDQVMQGVWHVESGNNHIDPKTGKITTSSSGALGVSQLLPSTAKGLGGNPYNEDENRAMGKQYLSQMFQKYGNWRDALGAYFKGPGAYDKWLDSGSPRTTQFGKEVTNYQDKALAYAGVAGPSGTVGTAPDGSRLLSNSALEALYSAAPPGATSTEEGSKRPQDTSFLENSLDRAKALGYSLYKGARDVELGTVQAGLEQVAPETARWLTNRVNEVDAPWRPMLNRHGILNGVGELVGSTAAIMAAARLLGPVALAGGRAAGVDAVTKLLAPRIPWMLNEAGGLTTAGRVAASVPVGAGISAGTALNPSGNTGDRIVEGILGGIAGPLGVALGRGVSKAMTVAATGGEQARMMQALKDNAAILGPDLNYLKDVAVRRLQGVESNATARYNAATNAGQRVAGLDAKVLQDTIDNYQTRAVSQIEQTKKTLGRVMGLDDEAKRAAAAAVRQQQYSDHVRAVTQAQDKFIDGLAGKQYTAQTLNDPAFRAALRSSLQTDPAFPQVTMPAPTPYVPNTISAEQFMKGRQLLRKEMDAAASNRAKRQQIAGLRKELDQSFAAAAKDAGMTATEFYRKLLSADRYYKSQVAPAHDVLQTFLGPRFRGSERIVGDAVNEFTAGADGTKIFNKVVDVVEGGTQKEVNALLHVFGSTLADKEKLVRAIAFRALTKAEGGIGKDFDPQVVKKYIDANHRNLERVMSPEQYKWMQGFANVVEEAGKQAQAAVKSPHRSFWRASNFLLIIGAEHALRGDFVHGAELALSGLAAHTLFNAVPQLRSVLPLNRLVKNAADLKPGSAALNRLMGQLQWRYAQSAATSTRFLGEKMSHTPVTAQQPTMH